MRMIFISAALSIAIIISSGCTMTKKWNRTIDQQLDVVPVRDNYQEGFYLGTTQEDSILYHRYLFPNSFSNSNNDYFEILLPITPGIKVAIVRTATSDDLPKTSRFNAMIEYNDPGFRPLNPKYEELQLMPERYPSSYPYFVIMNILRSGEKPRIAYGQRVPKPEKNSDKKHFGVCPETSAFSPYLSPSDNTSDFSKCDVWYWSDAYESSDTYGSFKKAGYSTLKYTGYLISVPIDIILAPFEAILIVIVFSNWSGH